MAKAKIGEYFIKAIEKLQSIKPANLEAGANVVKRIYQARTGTKLSQTLTTFKVVRTSYKALANYRKAYILTNLHTHLSISVTGYAPWPFIIKVLTLFRVENS